MPLLFVVDSRPPFVNVDLVMSWVEDKPDVISVTVEVDPKKTEVGSVDSLLESLVIVDGVVSDSVAIYAAFVFVVTSPGQTGKLDAGMVGTICAVLEHESVNSDPGTALEMRQFSKSQFRDKDVIKCIYLIWCLRHVDGITFIETGAPNIVLFFKLGARKPKDLRNIVKIV